jgi:hypothetical protein
MQKKVLMTGLHIISCEKNQVSELGGTVRVYDVQKCTKRLQRFCLFLTKWSLSNRKWMQNVILRFSLFGPFCPPFAFKLVKSANITKKCVFLKSAMDIIKRKLRCRARILRKKCKKVHPKLFTQ